MDHKALELEMAMRMREYAVHAEYAGAAENLIHMNHI